MKINIEFNLANEEDKYDWELFQKMHAHAQILEDFQEYLRSITKYQSITGVFSQEIYDRFYEIMNENLER